MLYPTALELLWVQLRLTLCCGAGLPVPVRDSLRLEFVALLANARVADAVPLAWGVNTIVTGTLCPALTVKGKVTPLNLNSDVVSNKIFSFLHINGKLHYLIHEANLSLFFSLFLLFSLVFFLSSFVFSLTVIEFFFLIDSFGF